MKLRRFLAPILVALAILVALLFVVTWLPLREARQAWRQGNDAQAVAIAQCWARARLWPSQYAQLLAAANLTAGNRAAAEPHLRDIGTPLLPALAKEEVARRLFARKRYADFLAYDAASHERSEAPDVAIYRAAALAGTNRTADAAAALRGIDRSKVDGKMLAALQSAIAQRANGSVPWVFDRDGGAIANWRPATNEVEPVSPDFAPLVDRAAGALTFGAQLPHLGTSTSVETTLDPFVQHAALQALGKVRGSIVVIDPRTSEVLAIASSARENLALERQYEPGSVVKVLTGLNALTNGVDVKSMFPYTCKGELMIEGRRFGDWMPQGHGTLNGIDDALAVSCNIYFADLGIRLGRERLERFMRAAGFGGETNAGLFDLPLGKFAGSASDDFETAFLAIGLKYESVDAFHLAMLASMMANRGVLTTPRLLRQRRSLLGEIVTLPPRQGSVRLGSAEAADTMIRAMQAVATEPHGTGRRAEVSGLSIAMKTGTAGERSNGLEALIMAFAPVEQPKIAFGIIGENAGPAEFAGAKIAHDFLEAMKGRL